MPVKTLENLTNMRKYCKVMKIISRFSLIFNIKCKIMGNTQGQKDDILKTQQYQWFTTPERVDTDRQSYKMITAVFALCKPMDCHGGFIALKRCVRNG